MGKVNNSTPIKNDVLQKLIATAGVLSASEMACALLVYRKTIGWNKKTDRISISQFSSALSVSRPTICKSLKTLRLVKICLLVKKGQQSKVASEWAFNENVEKWELVKKPLLVKKSKLTSKDIEIPLVKISRPTKETLQKKLIQKKENTNLDFSVFSKASVMQKMEEEFAAHRAEKKAPLTQRAIVLLASKLNAYPENVAIAAINRSIESTWTGIFPEREKDTNAPPTEKELRQEFLDLGEKDFREKYRLQYKEKRASEMTMKERDKAKHLLLTIKARNLRLSNER